MLKYYYKDYDCIAGVDEAGRGCIAGPVVAAAVILNPSNRIEGINDSKKLSPKRRTELARLIRKHAIEFKITFVDNNTIDQINILNASFLAMQKSIMDLHKAPDISLIDGHMFRTKQPLQHQCIVKGDSQYAAIAAASILAKVERDRFMEDLHSNYSCYEWNRNKGYPTKGHIEAVKQQGYSPYHRNSFHIKALQLSFGL